MLKFHIFYCFFISLCSLLLTFPAFAQLSLTSTTPSDGAVNVDTLATFTFTFNQSLDTTARFAEPQGFFLGIQVFPSDSVGEPEEILLNSSLDTVTVKNLPLTPNTKFVFILTGARSTTGEFLDHPYVRTFTTGSSLPGGSVSGTVDFPGGDPIGTTVGLFSKPPFGSNDENGDDEPEAVAIVSSSSGDYIANYVPGGTYFVLSFKDINQDGEFMSSGDAFGTYDTNGDYIGDPLTLSEGENLTGVDFTESVFLAVTARQNFSTAQTIARSQYTDAALSVIGSEYISIQGESTSWGYIFYSAIQDTALGVTSIGDYFFTIPIPMMGGEGPVLNSTLPETWIDSDVAADSAEAHGGNDFRNTYPDAEVNAFAGVFVFTDTGGTALPKSLQNRLRNTWPSRAQHHKTRWFFDLSNKDAYVDTLALWVFFYYSGETSQEYVILLDVETGRPIEFPWPGGPPTAARDNLAAADQASLLWANDAVLVLVGNASPDLTASGLATVWAYVYYSATKDSVRTLLLVDSIITGVESHPSNWVPSLETLPQGWLDTPVITPIAETQSNNFRNDHPDATVQATLSRGTLPEDPSRAIWKFTYYSEADIALLFIYLDALTGDVITGLDEDPESANIPRTFALQQNYPNPFNPETVIEFQLPRSSDVEISIFNLLGQKITTLLKGHRTAGIYKISWKGTDESGRPVASGLYFYRMKAGSFVSTKKMLLLR